MHGSFPRKDLSSAGCPPPSLSSSVSPTLQQRAPWKFSRYRHQGYETSPSKTEFRNSSASSQSKRQHGTSKRAHARRPVPTSSSSARFAKSSGAHSSANGRTPNEGASSHGVAVVVSQALPVASAAGAAAPRRCSMERPRSLGTPSALLCDYAFILPPVSLNDARRKRRLQPCSRCVAQGWRLSPRRDKLPQKSGSHLNPNRETAVKQSSFRKPIAQTQKLPDSTPPIARDRLPSLVVPRPETPVCSLFSIGLRQARLLTCLPWPGGE